MWWSETVENYIHEKRGQRKLQNLARLLYWLFSSPGHHLTNSYQKRATKYPLQIPCNREPLHPNETLYLVHANLKKAYSRTIAGITYISKTVLQSMLMGIYHYMYILLLNIH